MRKRCGTIVGEEGFEYPCNSLRSDSIHNDPDDCEMVWMGAFDVELPGVGQRCKRPGDHHRWKGEKYE
jgi:hypothetical protein